VVVSIADEELFVDAEALPNADCATSDVPNRLLGFDEGALPNVDAPLGAPDAGKVGLEFEPNPLEKAGANVVVVVAAVCPPAGTPKVGTVTPCIEPKTD